MDSIWSSPQALSLLVQQSTQRFELLRWPLKNFKKPFSFTPCSPQASRGMVMRLGACPSGKGSSWYVMKRRRVVLFLPESFLCVCKILNYFLGPNCIWFSGEHSTESNQSPQSWSMGCIYSSEANYCRGLSSCVIADPWTTRHWILLCLLSRFQYRTNAASTNHFFRRDCSDFQCFLSRDASPSKRTALRRLLGQQRHRLSSSSPLNLQAVDYRCASLAHGLLQLFEFFADMKHHRRATVASSRTFFLCVVALSPPQL